SQGRHDLLLHDGTDDAERDQGAGQARGFLLASYRGRQRRRPQAVPRGRAVGARAMTAAGWRPGTDPGGSTNSHAPAQSLFMTSTIPALLAVTLALAGCGGGSPTKMPAGGQGGDDTSTAGSGGEGGQAGGGAGGKGGT